MIYERSEDQITWETVERFYVLRVFSGSFQYPEHTMKSLENGEVIRTTFAFYRCRN